MIWVSLICNLILVVHIARQAQCICGLSKACNEYNEICRKWAQVFAEKRSISEISRKMYQEARKGEP